MRTRLQELVTAKLVDVQEWRLGPSAGRLPNVYWLTVKGARLVAESGGTLVESPPLGKSVQGTPGTVC